MLSTPILYNFCYVNFVDEIKKGFISSKKLLKSNKNPINFGSRVLLKNKEKNVSTFLFWNY